MMIQWNLMLMMMKSNIYSILVLYIKIILIKSDQDDYSDDDDVSWKIRRASAKCLEAIICTRHDLLSLFYSEISPLIISRFKGNNFKIM